MAYCPDCGSEIQESASFCQSCGTELEKDSSKGETSTKQTSEHTDLEPSQSTESDRSTIQRVLYPESWTHRLIGFLLALLPAMGAYLGVSIASYSTDIGWLFWLLTPVFTYLIIQAPSWKSMLGKTLFWLSIEVLALPVVLLVYTFVLAGQTSSSLGALGAGIGGIIMIIVAFLVGIPLAGVLYLLSTRLSPSGDPAA